MALASSPDVSPTYCKPAFSMTRRDAAFDRSATADSTSTGSNSNPISINAAAISPA
ncbi:hypothetical protein D3C81_2281030 [compost metagenome]